MSAESDGEPCPPLESVPQVCVPPFKKRFSWFSPHMRLLSDLGQSLWGVALGGQWLRPLTPMPSIEAVWHMADISKLYLAI